jgi:hypothetical protein
VITTPFFQCLSPTGTVGVFATDREAARAKGAATGARHPLWTTRAENDPCARNSHHRRWRLI